MDPKHTHLRLKFAVSGAAETGHCGIDAYDKGLELGRQVAKHDVVTINGATTGFPLWAVMGAKEAGGYTIGFSPANSEREHIEQFNLPVEYLDLIIYTGFGYPGRDLILTRSSDAVLFGCGRIGTIHEFTIAFEDQKPIGILESAGWETDEELKNIIELVNKDKINRASFRFDTSAPAL